MNSNKTCYEKFEEELRSMNIDETTLSPNKQRKLKLVKNLMNDLDNQKPTDYLRTLAEICGPSDAEKQVINQNNAIHKNLFDQIDANFKKNNHFLQE